MSWDDFRPARDDYRDWQDSVDRDWDRRLSFERWDELYEKGGGSHPDEGEEDVDRDDEGEK